MTLTTQTNRVNSLSMTLDRALRLLLLPTAALLLCQCRDAPDVVLTEARQALVQKDTEAFLLLLEPKAAALLRAAPQVVSRSGSVYKVLRDGKPTGVLLPKGEVVDVVETGHRAVVVVKGTEKAQVPMRLCDGQWRIDLLEMDTFYRALRPIE